MPDAEPTKAGALMDCDNIIPGVRGLCAGPGKVPAINGMTALPGQARGAAVVADTAGNRRTYVGTQTALYQVEGTNWTNVSRAGGYVGTDDSRWSFATFGNLAIVSDGVSQIQYQSTLGSPQFASISGAPAAEIVVGMKDFVLAFDTAEGVYGDGPDRWWCSAFQNGTSWTPNTTSQANTGRLVGIPGKITAAAPLGAYVVAYKERGAYLGQYVGPPIVWQFDAVPSEFGCVGKDALCDVGGAHFVVGPDGIWLFDGTRPQAIDAGIKQWFYQDLSLPYRSRVICHYERQKARVWVFYPSSAGEGRLDSAIVYGLNSRMWGRANHDVEAVFRFTSPTLTMDTLGTVAPTFDDLPDIPFDSPFWSSASSSMAIIDNDHMLHTLTGESGESWFKTADMGEDFAATFVRRVMLHFSRAPDASTCTGYTREVTGSTEQMRSNTQMRDDNAYDVTQDGRWHSFRFAFEGDMEASAIVIDARKAGRR